MRVSRFEYLEPKSVVEASSLLRKHQGQAKIVAGGTDILVRMKQRITIPPYLVTLKRIAGLDAISDEPEGLRIGALTTLSAIQRSSLVLEKFPVLAQAASSVGATHHQNMGTLGGNLCLDTRCWYYNQPSFWHEARPACLKRGGDICHMAKGSLRCYALYSGDMAPVLVALGAQVTVLRNRSERTFPVEKLFTGDGQSHLTIKPTDILVGVTIPYPLPHGTAYVKFRRREAIDFPMVGVAAALYLSGPDGTCLQAKAAVTGAISAPATIKGVSELLSGKILDDALVQKAARTAFQQIRPVSHMECSAAYRRRLVQVLTHQALTEAWQQGRMQAI